MLFKILNLELPHTVAYSTVHYSGVYYYESVDKQFYIQNHNGIFRYHDYAYSSDISHIILYHIRYNIEIIDKEMHIIKHDMNYGILNEILNNRVEHVMFDMI